LSWCRELAAALALAAPLAANAQSLSASGEASSRLEAIANPLYSVPASDTALRLTARVQGTAALRTEASDATLSGQVARHFSDEERLDTTDGSLQLAWRRRFERDSLTASAGVLRDSTVFSELATTGILLTRTQRDSYTAALGGEHEATERTTLFGNGNLSAQRYDRSQAPSGLVDNDVAFAEGGFRYRLNSRTTAGASLRAAATRFDPIGRTPSSTGTVTTYTEALSAQATLSYTVSERLSLNAAVGPSRVRSEFSSGTLICPAPALFCALGLVPLTVVQSDFEDTTSGRLFNLAAIWQADPRSTLTASASRSLAASGAGFVSVTEALSAVFERHVRESLSLAFDGIYSRAQAVGGVIPSRTVRKRIGARLDWQLDEWWSAEAGAWSEDVQLVGGANPRSSTIFVGFRYAFRERKL
jgi:long-subunit fatty acid transport protein